MKSLLVIGGSETLSRLFIEMFEKRGWRVETSGKHWDTAIARLAGNKSFDAVILIDSFKDKLVVDLIKLIRSLEHRRLIALVIVARTGELTREAVIAAGGDELVIRPFSPNSLIWAIDKLSSLPRDKEYLKLP